MAVVAAFTGDPAAAQTPEDEVLAVVVELFAGMRAGDTTAMRATLHPDARLMATGARPDGTPASAAVPVERWLEGVAGATETLDERIYEPEIRVAENMATVWTYYTLHVGGQFSHCGHDAFQLARTDEGWLITQVTDTRRTEDCDIPENP